MTLRKRLGSMLLDHAIMCFVIVVIAIPFEILSFLVQRYFDYGTIWITGVPIFIVYLNKDFFRAKSPAKRIVGLQIIDRQTGQPANELKCFLRNMTMPLWPLEVLVTLFSPTRRLGDFITNTKIEIADKEPIISIFQDLKKTKLTRLTLWTVTIGVIYMGVLWSLMDSLMTK